MFQGVRGTEVSPVLGCYSLEFEIAECEKQVLSYCKTKTAMQRIEAIFIKQLLGISKLKETLLHFVY